MKTTLGKLRSILMETKVMLVEGVCPGCGSKGAYIGMNDVECDNPKCKHFSQKQASPQPQPQPQAPQLGSGFGIGGACLQEIDFATLMTLDQVAAMAYDVDHASGGQRDGEKDVIFVFCDPSATNEGELQERLEDEWSTITIQHNGQRYALAYGDSVDDEYGWLWEPTTQTWVSYMY